MSSPRITPLLAALALAAAAVPASAVAAPAAGTVLVKLDPSSTAAERAEVWHALGARSSNGLPRGWRAYRLPRPSTLPDVRRRLAATGADVAVELDGRVTADLTPNDPGFAAQYALAKMRVPQAWDAGTGPPVVVAVIDSGVRIDHPDLAGMLWTNPGEGAVANGLDDDGNGLVDDIHGWDFRSDDASVYDDPVSDDHGTHVAGIIAAERGNASGVAGVAPNARIMTVKFLGPDGSGFNSDAIQALTYAREMGAKVVNLSWGGTYSVAVCDAVQAAESAGVVVVAAAGNAAQNLDTSPRSPAACPSPALVTVAATDQFDDLATFSNYGALSTDIGAPGVSILSTWPTPGGGGTEQVSGTSMAAPQVSGLAALALGASPGLDPAGFRSALLASATPAAALTGRTFSGRRADAFTLVQSLVSPGSDVFPPAEFSPLTPAAGEVTGSRPSVSWPEVLDLGTGVARYRAKVDGSVVADVPAGVFTATPTTDLADGPHTLVVEAVDRAGNVRASAPRAFSSDTAPPAAFAQSAPAAGAAVRTRQPAMSWAASSDAAGLAGYRLVVDGLTGPLLGPEVLSSAPGAPLADGAHTWEVRAYDTKGRETSTGPRTVLVDLAPPPVFLLRTPLPFQRTTARRPTLSWTRPAGGAVTFDVVLDGRQRATGLTRTSWRPPAPLSPGRHTWRVRAVDGAGNARLTRVAVFVVAARR